ncbi:hypothetical protein QTO30_01405 [Yoonia sp. GPGPB17]
MAFRVVSGTTIISQQITVLELIEWFEERAIGKGVTLFGQRR